MAIFEKQQKIRFADTDYAGIIFYPRYFEMLNGLIEDWFAEALGASFQSLIQNGHGAPLVNVETQFHAPFRIGDMATLNLQVTRLGDKSVSLHVVAKHNDQMMITSDLTIVHARRDMTGADPWPKPVHQVMKSYLKASDNDA